MKAMALKKNRLNCYSCSLNPGMRWAPGIPVLGTAKQFDDLVFYLLIPPGIVSFCFCVVFFLLLISVNKNTMVTRNAGCLSFFERLVLRGARCYVIRCERCEKMQGTYLLNNYIFKARISSA
jgi:hypothetical protein